MLRLRTLGRKKVIEERVTAASVPAFSKYCASLIKLFYHEYVTHLLPTFCA
jgi:hypothetical protein